MKILYFDAASTTGQWNWRDPELSPTQPHLIRYAALLSDDTLDHDLESACRLIQPQSGWPMIDSVGISRHNIDQKDIDNLGVPLAVAMVTLTKMMEAADLIVAHSAAFHSRMLRRAYRDMGIEPPEAPPYFCTMQNGADVVRVTLQGNGRWKWPSLPEAYTHFANAGMSLSADPHSRGMEIVHAVKLVHQGIVADAAARHAALQQRAAP